MLPAAIILTRIVALAALPTYVDHNDIPDIQTSYPAVNLDLLRYLSDVLINFFQADEKNTTAEPRGMNFAQFVTTNKCSNPAAWQCFTDIDTNNDGFVSPAEIAEYDKSAMVRVETMYDDYLANSFTEADNDDDGYVSYKEGEDYAENILKVKSDKEWERLFHEKDLDGDGQLDKKEFMSLVSSWYRGDYKLIYNDYTLTSPKSSPPEDEKAVTNS